MKKQPQLELDELQRLRWLLGGVLALVALPALLYLEVEAAGLMAGGMAAVLLVLRWPALPARVPAWAHRLVFPGAVVFAAGDFYLRGEPFPAAVRLAVLLLVYRACCYRGRREDMQLVLLGLLLVVVAGAITASLAFAAQIAVFAACALLLLLVVTLAEGGGGRAEGGGRKPEGGGGGGVGGGTGAPGGRALPSEGERGGRVLPPEWARGEWREFFVRWRAVVNWRLLALGGGLLVLLAALSAGLFLAIPRFQLDTGFAFDRLMSRRSATGFSDEMKFGDVVSIQKDDGVALRVEVSERGRLPEDLFFRMVVLDEYRDGTFQMSAGLKRAAFGTEATVVRVQGGEGFGRREGALTWTFYLEASVGKFLPLTGDFRRLLLTEPVALRWSPGLRVVMLGREPVAMKAYRVEGMGAEGALRGGAELGMGEPALGEADRAVLAAAVREIGVGPERPAREFAEAAMRWLARRHGYALETELPKGEGDPLVRWLGSDRAGHCELHAGAFALLARAAGRPVRVVTGFLGGTWNGDYLMVRNSNAHAWCEIGDGAGGWLRADPTNEGPRLLAGAGRQVAAERMGAAVGAWASRLDRLRMLWYRRIVNFDRGDQREMLAAIKARTEGAGRWLRAWAEARVEAIRGWVAGPWDVRRGAGAGAWILAVAVGAVLLWRFGPAGWRWGRGWRRGGREEGVRREAGRWLRRLGAAAGSGEPGAGRSEAESGPGTARPAVAPSPVEELLRLRYGRREGWPEAERVFREARRAGCGRKKAGAGEAPAGGRKRAGDQRARST